MKSALCAGLFLLITSLSVSARCRDDLDICLDSCYRLGASSINNDELKGCQFKCIHNDQVKKKIVGDFLKTDGKNISDENSKIISGFIKSEESEIQLTGCERTNASTITCGHEVFIKSSAVNGDTIVKKSQTHAPAPAPPSRSANKQ